MSIREERYLPFIKELYRQHSESRAIPPPSLVCDWLEGLLSLLFPELSEKRYKSEREVRLEFEQLQLKLYKILETLQEELARPSGEIAELYLDQVPNVRDLLILDAMAIEAGDPAAVNLYEVIRSYPGFEAIAVYRLAHEFYKLDVPYIPRILTEHAHSNTGVDIHPAARIGKHFCIDHATGVVIGETVEIGEQVKIYQGVTLGALSVSKEMARTKRHPTIGDRVVIYSGATILGGDTVIGHDSIIGGNVWVTESVPPFSKLFYKPAAQRSEDA